MSLRSEITSVFGGILPQGVHADVTVPENESQGYFSTNVAFGLAKERRVAPIVLATTLAEYVKTARPDLIERAEAVNPGFVNIWVTREALAREVKRVVKLGKSYGPDKLPKGSRKKIQLEFISANPTGPLTLANGRGGFLGDALANVLEAVGHSVEREYYVNDTGNQVATLGKSLLASLGLIPGEEAFYQGSYVSEWANAHADLVRSHVGDPVGIGQVAAAEFLGAIKEAVGVKAGIRFDRYTSEERDIHEGGYIPRVLEVFKARNVSYEQDGALWLRTTDFGDDKDRVLVKQDKLPTYFLADAGHYLETKDRGFGEKINILGPDHYGYVARIQAVAKMLELGSSEVIVTQAVRLMRGADEVKMSKRRGEFVTFGELIGEVGRDAARFFFLMTSPESHMDFDLGLAVERSTKNPVFYAQYAAVRARGILKAARKPFWITEKKLAPLSTSEDLALMRRIAQFPDVIEDSAKVHRVHRIAQYVLELAHAFHAFYDKERVSGEPKNIAQARAVLVTATLVTLENAFAIMGVSVPERM